MEHEITLETKLIPRFWLAPLESEKGKEEKKLINFKTFTGKLMLKFFSFHSFKFRFLLFLRIKGVEQKS